MPTLDIKPPCRRRARTQLTSAGKHFGRVAVEVAVPELGRLLLSEKAATSGADLEADSSQRYLGFLRLQKERRIGFHRSTRFGIGGDHRHHSAGPKDGRADR